MNICYPEEIHDFTTIDYVNEKKNPTNQSNVLATV